MPKEKNIEKIITRMWGLHNDLAVLQDELNKFFPKDISDKYSSVINDLEKVIDRMDKKYDEITASTKIKSNKKIFVGTLLNIANTICAVDSELESVARIVAENKFLDLREPLKKIGFRSIGFNYAGGPHWEVKTRSGKTIVVINKSNAEPSEKDIVVGDFVIGYL